MATTGVPGGMVDGGVLKLHNTSGAPMTISSVTIAFDNADLFSSTTLTGIAAGVSESSTFVPPLDIPSISYKFATPLTVPTGGDATFTLSLTITKTPQITMRRPQFVYAGLFDSGAGRGSPGLAALSGALMLLSLCTAVIGRSRRRTMIALIMLMLAVAATQVGCDNGSVATSGGPIRSTQTASDVAAASQTGGPMKIGGLPVFLSTVSLQQ